MRRAFADRPRPPRAQQYLEEEPFAWCERVQGRKQTTRRLLGAAAAEERVSAAPGEVRAESPSACDWRLLDRFDAEGGNQDAQLRAEGVEGRLLASEEVADAVLARERLEGNNGSWRQPGDSCDRRLDLGGAQLRREAKLD